ncbi:MAG: tRNA epoxyqueuosine(34) reductase QueG [Planctomycetota bacterium]|mgnify:CR=1 FL=1|nr:MAG: tRNA epoxyqueuosine(34) reductase QueG [Planctomycetota bacterium]
MDKADLTAALKTESQRQGFDLAGVCPAAAPPGLDRFGQWLAADYAGTMDYLANRKAAYRHPRSVLDGVRSLLVLAFPYRTVEPDASQPTQGRVSRYAWGQDYHDVVRERLRGLGEFLAARSPEALWRGVVDTAPLLEREFAQLAGLGWIGKNTLLLNQRSGSWFFLAALLTDAELDYDQPHPTDHCGTCRACLDACPTEAFVEPYVLDARRCISYLTIELREQIPRDLRTAMGDWLFGCDVCQDVCPWNHRVGPCGEEAFEPRAGTTNLDLVGLFALDELAFRQRFRHTPLWRPRRRGLLRNAAIVLGNQRPVEGIEALERGLRDDESLVRGACAWALGRYDSATARAALVARSKVESDPGVRAEIELALAGNRATGPSPSSRQ